MARAPYRWLVVEAFLRKQIISARFLLAIEKYDAAKGTQKATALVNIEDACSNIEQSAEELFDIYSRTRFLKVALGYIECTKHHRHLALRALDSSWMVLYEIQFIEAVRDWLAGQGTSALIN